MSRIPSVAVNCAASRTALMLSVVLLASCASLPPPTNKIPEHAFTGVAATSLRKQSAATPPTPDASGFRMLQAGEDAFGALNVLIDRAQHSLDLQYYLVRDEVSARKLLRQVH